MAAADDRLAAHEAGARAQDRFADVIFEDAARLPLWMDFTVKSPGNVDLNLAPKDKGEAFNKARAVSRAASKWSVERWLRL